MRKLILLISFGAFVLSNYCVAQSDNALSVSQLQQYTEQSKQLVSYLEGTLNFIGDPQELPSEKDIIFNESYLKIFASDKVQIEDDLDENREIPLNKDVQAYLKDIDFFFKEVKFQFEIEEVDQFVTDSNIIVFKVSLNRNIEGVTVGGDTVSNNQLRYIEINLDPLQKDLKIASIYTTKVREKEELRYWWNNMSTEWKTFFGKSIIVYDTLPFQNIVWFSDSSIVINRWEETVSSDTALLIDDGITDPPLFAGDTVLIVYDTTNRLVHDTIEVSTNTVYRLLKSIKNIKYIDISNSLVFNNLVPLSELSEIIELDISNTLIEDLQPIRNLKKLEAFNCSGSAIISLGPLRYINSLTEINITNTQVSDISVFSNLKNLRKIYLSYSEVDNLDILQGTTKLSHLEASGTDITDLSPINNLDLLSDLIISKSSIKTLSSIDSMESLQHLNIDSTQISNIEALSGCLNLGVLQANNTQISTLEPLNNHPKLNVIYCDNSNINMSEANRFMDTNPNTLVIYNSQELVNWWDNLSVEWQTIFKNSYNITVPVTKEKLHVLINQTDLSVAFNKNIKSLDPLMMLHRLETLELQNTSIVDLKPLSGLNNLESINLNNTEVITLEPLVSLHNLKEIRFENTKIDNLIPLESSNKLEFIYCDKSGINDEMVFLFNQKYPDCLIIYQSQKLQMWWNGLNADWQSELQKPLNLPSNPSNEELQQLVSLKTLSLVGNMSLNNLNPIHIFVGLVDLTVNNTSVSDISPILSITTLKKLDISKNPIYEFGSISNLINLEELILRNTSVDDLEPISELNSLIVLDIAGTKIKSLKYVDRLSNLEKLFINNTRIKNLKPIFNLKKLSFLQCYNTSVKSSKIDDYKHQFPKVEVVFY